MILCPFRFKDHSETRQMGCMQNCALYVVRVDGTTACALSLASDEPRTPYMQFRRSMDAADTKN